MKTLLVIHSSPMGEHSKTRQLSADFARQWQAANPEGRVVERDLAAAPPPHLDAETIAAFYTPAEARGAEQLEKIALSEALVDELESADVIAIGSPMHNFSISSQLKTWIDHVARVGRTFQYTENGPVGLLSGKQVVVIAARGGHYAVGSPAAAMNHQDSYLRTVLGFIGLDDVRLISAEGVASGEEGLQQAREEIQQQAA